MPIEMPHFTDLTGLLGLAFVAASLVLALLRKRLAARSGMRCLMIGGALLLALLLLPFGGLPLAAYLRGATGDLSITTLVLVAASWQRHATDRMPAMGLITLGAVLLYPMALGLGPDDPYRWGYGEPVFLVALLALTLAAWLRGQWLIATAIALAVLAWSAGWYESNNLWDYLLDPLLAIYASVVVVQSIVRALLQRQKKA